MERERSALGDERDNSARAAEESDAAAALAEAQLATTSEQIRATEARRGDSRGNRHARSSTGSSSARAAELEKEAERLRRQLSAVNVRAGSLEQQLQETAAQLATAESDYARMAAAASAEDERLVEVTSRLTSCPRRRGVARRVSRRNAPHGPIRKRNELANGEAGIRSGSPTTRGTAATRTVVGAKYPGNRSGRVPRR